MRIFFGATLPEKTKREITSFQELLRADIPEARFEGADKLHITLLFVGDFDPARADGLFKSARDRLESCARNSPYTEVAGVNYFPNMKIRRGIWLDCKDDGTLASFAGAIAVAASDFGVVPERREFKPHITVARLPQFPQKNYRMRGRRNEALPERHQVPADLKKFTTDGKLNIERFYPRSIALYESMLKPSGSEYRILSEHSLEQSEA